MAKKRGPVRNKSGSRKLASNSEAELQRIENLLGEEFDSLAQARKALKTDTGPKPNKLAYTVGELSSKKHKTIKTLLPDLEEHTAEIDNLKADQDYWAAEIYGAKTYSVYASIEGLAKKLGTYKGLQEENPKAALKNIKIIRIRGQNALDKYIAARRKQTEESWKRTKEKHKEDRKRTRKQAGQLRKMKDQIKAQKALIKKLQKKKS